MIESPKELRKICQGRADDWWGQHIMRKISIYFTWLFLHTRATANQVTFLFIIIGVIGVFFLIMGSRAGFISGGIMLFISIILDYVDGEIARYRKASSLTGSLLELVGHDIVNPLIFFGLGYGIYRSYHNVYMLVLGFVAGFSLYLACNMRKLALYAIASGSPMNGKIRRLEKGVSIRLLDTLKEKRKTTSVEGLIKKSLFLNLFRTDVVALVIMITAYFGKVYYCLLFYGMMLLLRCMFFIYREIRQMQLYENTRAEKT